MGYDLFDCSLPTRDARRGRLYTFTADISPADGGDRGGASDWFSYIYATDDKHTKSDALISVHCDCPCCTDYSLGYLHHLFEIKESLALRLATMHNLRFMTQLMARLREE
jgi:queuine tRNA-ribosyltransferase